MVGRTLDGSRSARATSSLPLSTFRPDFHQSRFVRHRRLLSNGV